MGSGQQFSNEEHYVEKPHKSYYEVGYKFSSASSFNSSCNFSS